MYPVDVLHQKVPHLIVPDLKKQELQRFLPSAIRPLKMTELPSAKLVLLVELDKSSHMWFAGSAGNSLAGPVPFRAIFNRCEEIGLSTSGLKVIRLSREVYVQPLRPLPFGGHDDQRIGATSKLTLLDIAALVLEGNVRPKCIEFTQYNVRLLHGDKFEIVGPDSSVSPLVFLTDHKVDVDKPKSFC